MIIKTIKESFILAKVLVSEAIKYLILATLCNFCWASSEREQIDNEISLEGLYDLPFIDIATGYAVPLEKAPSVATIISAQDIEAMGALTIEDVLESVPGIHVQPSTLEAQENFSIRGMFTSFNPQVLILLNGYRISSDAPSGSFPSSGVITVQNIARIEIIRGPGSAVYGADAFSGVINIVTKNAKDINGFHFGSKAGSFNTKNVWGQYGGKVGLGWELAFNFEYMKQGSDNSRMINSDAQTELDLLFGTSASQAPDHINSRFESSNYNIHLKNKHWKIGWDGFIQRNVGQGVGIAQALDNTGHADHDQFLLSVEYNNKEWFPSLDFTSKLSYQEVDAQWYFRIFPAGNISLVGSDGNLFTAPYNPVLFTDGVIGNPGRKTTIPSLDMTFLYDGFEKHILRLNFGSKQEKLEANATQNFGPSVIDGTEGVVDGTLSDVTGTPYVYVLDKTRKIHYVSLQDVWELSPDWTLTLGVRYDHYSDFGSTTNPRMAVVWTPTAELTTKLMYGSAFRAPSFNELYAQNNPVGIGNSNLEPETIDTFELAFAYEPFFGLKTNTSFYYYKADNMIDFIGNGDGSKTAQNSTQIRGQGVELEVDWKLSKKFNILANFAYQKTIDKETDKQRPYVPQKQIYLNMNWTFFPDWLASAQLNWVGDRKRAAQDSRSQLDDYTWLNLRIQRKNIAKHWGLALTAKNIFNESVVEPSDGSISGDYPMKERSVFFEVSYAFNQ